MNFPFPSSDAKADDPAEILLFQALNTPSGERGEFLDAQCGQDAALRGEVEGLLRDYEKAGSFLRVDATVPMELKAEFARLQPEAEGDRIGPYKLLQQIGEGGFGVVWMAEQEQPVRRRVALKIIKPGMDTKEVVARFEQERQALAVMEHPNIARVLDAGVTQFGRPYFVMELVRGTKITQYCDEAQLTTHGRLQLFIAVCHAVQHAHQKGIIHRDLKPSNILVTLHDGVAVPKVIDFGVAKAIQQQRLSDLTVFTRFEQMIGTPLYMSPEQAEMSGLDIDTRSDIYSLGVLLYELLTGRTPFDPETLLKQGIDEIRRVIREEEPQKPSTYVSTLALPARRTLAQHRQSDSGKLPGQIQGDLDWIVMKALEKDRRRRYETATGFAQDIQRHLENEPVMARPPTVSYRFRRFAKRNKLVFTAGAGIAAALVAGMAVSTWMFLKERQARERAVAAESAQSNERRKAETEAAKSRQVAQFLKNMLNGVGPSTALGRDTTMLMEILNQTAEYVGKDLKDQPEVEADLRGIIGNVYMALGKHENALSMHSEALEMRKKLYGDEHAEVAASLHDLANLPGIKDGEKMHREALALRRKLLGNGHADVAESLVSLAINLRGQGKFAEGEILASEAVAITKKCFGNEHPRVAAALLAMSSVVGHQGRFAESEAIHLEVLAMRRKLLGELHPDVAESLSHLADVKESQTKWVEAADYARQSLEMDRKLLGEDHKEIERMLSRVASIQVKGGKLPEAETAFREALALKRKRKGDDNHTVAYLMIDLARVLIQEDKLSEAASMCRDSLAILRKLDGDESPDVAVVMNDLGKVCDHEADDAGAEAWFRKAVAIFTKVSSNKNEIRDVENHNMAMGLLNLSVPLYYQGRFLEAEARCWEALAISRAIEDTPMVADGQVWLSEVMGAQNNLSEAVSGMREGVATYRRLAPQFARERASAIVSLASLLRRTKNYGEAEALCREVMEGGVKPMDAEYDPAYSAEAFLAHVLIDWSWDEMSSSPQTGNPTARRAERARESVRLLTACMAAPHRPENVASKRSAGRISSLFGGALLSEAVSDPVLSDKARQARLAEAEKAMLEGGEKMRRGWAKVDINHRRDALALSVRLYKAWDRKEQATVWQRKLDALEKSEPD